MRRRRRRCGSCSRCLRLYRHVVFAVMIMAIIIIFLFASTNKFRIIVPSTHMTTNHGDDIPTSLIDAKYKTKSASCSEKAGSSSHGGTATNLVPRIIHQTYKTEVLPENFQTWREECKVLNPCWEFKLWTDENNLDLVSTYYPELLSMYQGYDVHIKRVDAARYLMLHRYGGVYMDMDLTCLRGFNDSTFARENTFYAARQHPKGGDEAQRVANAFMASTPGHPFLSKIIAALNGTKDLHVVMATGPAFLTSLIDGEKGERLVEENDDEIITVVVDQENGTIVEFTIEAMFSVPYYAKGEIEMCAANRTACLEKYYGYLFSFWTHTWL